MRVNKGKVVKISGMIVGSLLTLCVIATLAINFLFKDQLIRVVINQLNNQINTKVNIGKVDFSLWKQFPNVSVWFDKVYIQSSNKFKAANNITHADTLLLADKVFFEFNLIKLLQSRYELKRLAIKDGYIKLKVDKNGLLNYDIIKPSPEKKSATDFSLEMNDLIISNSNIEYMNAESAVAISGSADKLGIKGKFGNRNLDLHIDSKLFLKQLMVKNVSYIANKSTHVKLNLSVRGSEYTISDAECSINKLYFQTAGNFSTGENGRINLNFNSKNADFDQVVAAMPESVMNYLNGYSVKGKANINVTLTSRTSNPVINASYTVKNGSIVQISSGIKLKDLLLVGTYHYENKDNVSQSLLNVSKTSFLLGSGRISGDFEVNGNIHPFVKVNMSYVLNLNEVKEFLNLDTLEEFSGKVEGSLLASGNVSFGSASRLLVIDNMSCTGQLQLHNVGIKAKSSDYYFEKINGSVSIDDNVNFKDISLYVLDNNFLINGSLLSWSNYLLKHQKDVTLKADISSKSLDLSKYFSVNKKKTDAEHSSGLLFPDNLNLEVKVNINNFKLNRFNAKWISGYLNYKPKIFVLKSLTFETMDGRVTGNGAVIQDMSRNFIVKGQVDIAKLDIKQLFYTFNNFSQTVLLDKHLKGRASGKVGLTSQWDNNLVFDKEKLLVDADVTLEKGELSNFEPMMKLSKFIALDELSNIRFSTLKNRITIKDKQIIIPQMSVNSSAFDISASGLHLFDNHYNYRLKVLFSDILWGKARRAKRENEEFGVVEDDGLGKTSIPISITGYNSDYKITYDSRKAMDVMKESLGKQKKEMKSALHDEFGWFKKDTTLTKSKTEKKPAKFRVEWDEASDNKNDKKEEKKSSQQTRTQVEWDN